jgi:hypothetical protein
MNVIDSQAWAAAYNSEFGVKERGVFMVVMQQPGIRILLDTLTRLEYKQDNGEFIKCKSRLLME